MGSYLLELFTVRSKPAVSVKPTSPQDCARREISVKMCVAFKIRPFPSALGPAFDIRLRHGASFEAVSWRIHPAPADTV